MEEVQSAPPQDDDTMEPTISVLDSRLHHPTLTALSKPSSAPPEPPKAEKRKYVKRQQKRAPNAPKRAKSAYIFFSMAKRADATKRLKDGGNETPKVTEIMTALADDWRVLKDEQRQEWIDKADQDKDRYKAETQAYTGPLRVPNKRIKKSLDAPKRPMPAFLHWAKEARPKLRQEFTGLKNTEISKKLGQMWAVMPEEERRPHLEVEMEMRQAYKHEMAAWNEAAPAREAAERAQLNEERMQEQELTSLILAQQQQQVQENAAVLLMMNQPLRNQLRFSNTVGNSVVTDKDTGVGRIMDMENQNQYLRALPEEADNATTSGAQQEQSAFVQVLDGVGGSHSKNSSKMKNPELAVRVGVLPSLASSTEQRETATQALVMDV